MNTPYTVAWLFFTLNVGQPPTVIPGIASEHACHELARNLGYETTKRVDGVNRYLCVPYEMAR